jgi:hypothetical protein
MRTRELALREGFVHVPDEVKFWTLTPVEVGADDAHALPVLVRTLPAVLGATATAATPPIVVAPVNVEVPATVRLFPTATLPLASLTRLFTALEGWRMVTTLAVLISGLPYVHKTAAGLQRHKLMGVVGWPVNYVSTY